jgi:hypothetical protein
MTSKSNRANSNNLTLSKRIPERITMLRPGLYINIHNGTLSKEKKIPAYYNDRFQRCLRFSASRGTVQDVQTFKSSNHGNRTISTAIYRSHN